MDSTFAELVSVLPVVTPERLLNIESGIFPFRNMVPASALMRWRKDLFRSKTGLAMILR